uniref:Uncharacterized protein n=1 Tax=Arundo donax TaxID=35708 RepID=A0A0A8ZMY5_ARUDO
MVTPPVCKYMRFTKPTGFLICNFNQYSLY